LLGKGFSGDPDKLENHEIEELLSGHGFKFDKA
jgi:hypothetical protein